MPRILTHVLATLLGLLAGLSGLLLLARGGQHVWQAYMRFDLGAVLTVEGLGLQIAAAVLLFVTVLTAHWSPFGVLLTGLVGVLTLALAALPAALPGSAPLLPASAAGWFEALMSGPPQVIGAIAAGIGIGTGTLLIARRHERSAPNPPSAPLHLIGVLLVPVLFFGGLLLLLRGLGGAGQSHLLQVGIVADPLWLPALISGFALILAASIGACWSPFALLLPALVTLALTGFVFLQEFIFPLSAHLPTALPFFVIGGLGTSAALLGGSLAAILRWAGARRRRTSVDR